jgi:hypothetical protein
MSASKILKGILGVLLFQLFLFSIAFAQKKEPVDSFYYFVRNTQSADELAPLPEDHPNYKAPEVELTLVIHIGELQKAKSYEITLGNQKEAGDIKKWNFNLLKAEDKYYLRKGDKLYEVIEGKVIITEIVPASIYNRKMYLAVRKTDKAGKVLNKNRELN